MTDEEKKEIIAALKAESTDVTSLEVVSSLDGVTSLPAVQGNKLVRAPIPLLAKPATDAAETANAAAETANAAAERAESAAEIAETYIKTTDDEDKYVRGTLNMTDGTISESTQTGTIVCQQYIGIPEGTEQISVWLYSVTSLSGNAAVTFYDGQHNFLSANAVTANNVNAFELPNGARYLRYQMPAENVIEIRIAADGWTLAESFNPAKIKEDIPNEIRTGYSDDGVSIDLYHDDTSLWSDTIEPATKTEAGVMSSADKTTLDALALYNAKSVITVAGMDFTQGDILEIQKGHRPTRYAVKYETETSSYVCGILDAYTSRDGRVFTEIYTGGCDLAKDFTGGTHDSGRIYQFMRQYRIFGSGTPAAGTWSAWQSCLSSATMEELYAMGLDYEVFEGETDGYIEVKLTGKDGGVVGGSTEIPFASAAKSGFMSKEDKARLDGMETGANRTVVVQGYGDNAASVMSQAAVTLADRKLLDRMQGKSDDSNPYTDPFKLVRFTDSGYWEQFNEWLDGLHTATPEVDQQKAGFFRVSLWGILCEVKNLVINWDTMRFHQIVSGNLGINSQGKVGWSDKYTTLQRGYDGGAWSEWQEDAYEIRKTIVDDLRTGYSGSDVSLSLYHGQSRLFGNAINAATHEKAGVMSAEDKRHLDAALYEVEETAYFPDYVETQIRGYDGDGHSVTVKAATKTEAGVMSAEDKIEQRNIRTFIETFKKNLIPSGLTVSCLERITLGNVEPIYITAELTPDTAYRNIIYISDNKAVTVGTDGRVIPVSVGKSVVSVIPTCNTSLAKTIIVEVGRPFTRLVNNRSTLRFTSSGTFRLT